MGIYIFGYGSLINPFSASMTLGRSLSKNDIICIEIKNHIRIWDIVVNVLLNQSNILIPMNALFLDIRESVGKITNGVLIKVKKKDLEKMDIREKQYERIDVTKNIFPPLSNDDIIYTYKGRKEFFSKNYENIKILNEYKKIIDTGIQYWGNSFSKKFFSSTLLKEVEIVKGSYKSWHHAIPWSISFCYQYWIIFHKYIISCKKFCIYICQFRS